MARNIAPKNRRCGRILCMLLSGEYPPSAAALVGLSSGGIGSCIALSVCFGCFSGDANRSNPCGNGDIFALSGTSRIAWSAGPGLHFSVLGLVCIAFAVSRISRGLAVLPIHLNATPLQAGDVPQRRMGLTLVMRWHTTMG